MTNQDVKPEKVCCMGCRDDRKKHWSVDCWILQCCVDLHKLDYCYECIDFPCAKLIEWSKSDERYKKAFERLQTMKKAN